MWNGFCYVINLHDLDCDGDNRNSCYSFQLYVYKAEHLLNKVNKNYGFQ